MWYRHSLKIIVFSVKDYSILITRYIYIYIYIYRVFLIISNFKKRKVNGCSKGILVYELFLKIFYGKMIKQNFFLGGFYIFYECDVKTFLEWFIKNCLKGIR